jgi:thiamine-phosphate pyrophosphorylase
MEIYALLDLDTLKKFNIQIKDFTLFLRDLGIKILQYRDKTSHINEVKKNLELIKKYWDGVVIINDYIELLDFADGIHIGQEDLENLEKKLNLKRKDIIKSIKEKEKIVGLSTHNKEEILLANCLDLDYIGLGAYRNTSTKDTKNILGDKIFDLINLSYHPVAVIGGVKIYDKIPAKYKVIGSDLCRLMSIQSKKKKNLKKR